MAFSDCASRKKLTAMQAIVPTLGHSRVNPCVYFKPIAQATSNKPASRR